MASTDVSDATTKVQNLSLTSGQRSKLKGVIDQRFNGTVTHYRGIKYAKIAKRFALPRPITALQTDCTKFGPRCPQMHYDVRDLMQIPKNLPNPNPKDAENELECANLNVSCPSDGNLSNLPVFMWIYGGAQMITFGSASQRIGDPTALVAQSIEAGKPIVVVTIHYRLNIFAFGDGEDRGNVNLALEDQKSALVWIKRHIAVFGGDKDNVTIGGESAGGVYTHALAASGAEFDRAILASGCLHTSPPRSDKQGFGLVGLMEGNLQLLEFDKGNTSGEYSAEVTLAGAKAEDLVKTIKDLQLSSLWMWDEPYFKGWQDDGKVFKRLKGGVMVGDCENEDALYTRTLGKRKARQIADAFVTKASGPEAGLKIAKAYGIDGIQEDHAAAREAALRYLNDARFAFWAQEITKNVNAAGGKAYQYYYDEVNPFAGKEKARAHHAVDLFGIFGAFDEDVNDETRQVGRMLRTKYIDFINGEEPWRTDEVFLFGPNGMTGQVSREGNAAVQELNPRRRQAQFAVLKEVGPAATEEVWRNLSALASLAVEE